MKATVQVEMQFYSSVVAINCSAAFARIKTSFNCCTESSGKNGKKSKNVIIYKLKEETDELLQGKVETILAEVGPKPTI